jgi:hypothetical protein
MEMVTALTSSTMAQRQAPWRAKPAAPIADAGRMLVLCFLLAMITRTFTVSHIYAVMGPVEGGLVGLFAVWLGWRALQRCLGNDWRFSGPEITGMLISLVPIWAAFGAHRVFGQPVIYGILAFKDFYLLYGGLLILYWLKKGFFTISQVERALLIVAGLGLAYFYFASLFTDPGDYLDTPLAGANSVKGGVAYYRFNMTLVYFGAVYYSVKAFLQRRWLLLVPAALYAFYLVYFRLDRTSIAVLLVSVTVAIVFHVPTRRIARAILLSILPFLFGVLLLVVFVPDKLEQYDKMFADALGTVTGAPVVGEGTSVRVHEAAVADKYIHRYPLTGSGRIDHDFEETGYEKFMGYFFPADIGYLGLIFMYGFPVTILLFMLFPLGAVYALRVRGRNDDVFFITCKVMILSLALDSLTNGMLTQYVGQVMLFLCIPYYYAYVAPPAKAVTGAMSTTA